MEEAPGGGRFPLSVTELDGSRFGGGPCNEPRRHQAARVAALENMTKPLVTSVSCEVFGPHCHVSIWSRGQNAGRIVVDAADGIELAKRLVPHGSDKLDGVIGRFTRYALAEARVEREGYTLAALQDDDDRNLAHITLNGEPMGVTVWDEHRFRNLPIRFTSSEIENQEAQEALELAYAEAILNLSL